MFSAASAAVRLLSLNSYAAMLSSCFFPFTVSQLSSCGYKNCIYPSVSDFPVESFTAHTIPSLPTLRFVTFPTLHFARFVSSPFIITMSPPLNSACLPECNNYLFKDVGQYCDMCFRPKGLNLLFYHFALLVHLL